MNTQFDELAKGVSRLVSRRGGLKHIGFGMTAIVLGFVGLTGSAQAGKVKSRTCTSDADCGSGEICCRNICSTRVPDWCDEATNPCCCHCVGKRRSRYPATGLSTCNISYGWCSSICGSLLGFCEG